MRTRLKKHLPTLLKIAVTVIGIVIVLNSVELGDVGAVFADVRWVWVVVSLLLITCGLVLRAYRWQLLLHGLKVPVSFGRLVTLYFVGNFFNAFLLSGFGGDVVRILEVAKNVPRNVAAGTVLVDRLSGLLMLFAMSLIALPFRPASFDPQLTLVIIVLSTVGLGVGVVLLEGSLIRRFGRWLPGKLSPVGDGPVAKLLDAVNGSGRSAILGALAISTLFNLLLVTWWLTAGLALGYEISYSYYLIVIPILSVATLVPSVSGFGVRESLAPTLFAAAGLANAEAVALSLLVFIIMRVSSLLGGPVYIATTLRRREQLPVNE